MGHGKRGHAKEADPPRPSVVYSALLVVAGLAFVAGFVLAALGLGGASPLHVKGLGGAEIQTQSIGFGLMVLAILFIYVLLRYKPSDVGVFVVETPAQVLPAPERRVARWMLVVSIALLLVMVVLQHVSVR